MFLGVICFSIHCLLKSLQSHVKLEFEHKQMTNINNLVSKDRLGFRRLNDVSLKIYLYNPTSNFRNQKLALIKHLCKINLKPARQIFRKLRKCEILLCTAPLKNSRREICSRVPNHVLTLFCKN